MENTDKDFNFVIRDQKQTIKDECNFISARRHNPFFRNGQANPDAYIEFVTGYNEFINHQPKLFKKIIADSIKL